MITLVRKVVMAGEMSGETRTQHESLEKAINAVKEDYEYFLNLSGSKEYQFEGVLPFNADNKLSYYIE